MPVRTKPTDLYSSAKISRILAGYRSGTWDPEQMRYALESALYYAKKWEKIRKQNNQAARLYRSRKSSQVEKGRK